MSFLNAVKPLLSYVLPQRWLGASDDLSSAAAENQKLREDLALSYRGMAYYNLHERVENHLSVRAPARSGNGEVMLVISYGLHWSQVTASSLVGLDFESGEVVEGHGIAQDTAKQIHLALHRLRAADGITCVMHTHQPYTTALACCHGRLKNIHQTSLHFHNAISYDDDYGGLAIGDSEGERIAKHFIDKDICIMGNHGVTVIGKRICDVFDDMYKLERASMYQVLAMSTGMKLVEVPDHIAEEVANYADKGYHSEAHFEGLRPIIARMEPDYKS